MACQESENLLMRVFTAENLCINQYYIDNLDFHLRNESILSNSMDNYRGFLQTICTPEMDRYCGDFIEVNGTRSLRVHCKDITLICDLGWPALELIQKPDRDEFRIGSFPHDVKYLDFNTREITGKDMAGLKGKLFVRMQEAIFPF